MDLQVGQDLTNLPVDLAMPRATLPVFTHHLQQQQQEQQHNQALMTSQPNTAAYPTTSQCYQYLPQTFLPTLPGRQLPTSLHCVQSQQQGLRVGGGGGGGVLSDDDSGYDLMDDSLTDMQWLHGMDAGMIINLMLVCPIVFRPCIICEI